MMTFTWFFFLISTVVVPKAAVQEASTQVTAQTAWKANEWRSEADSVPDFARKRTT